jgi:hypothetical protein
LRLISRNLLLIARDLALKLMDFFPKYLVLAGQRGTAVLKLPNLSIPHRRHIGLRQALSDVGWRRKRCGVV